MSISSGLNAGVAGLSVNATKLATISDNIANANTSGYRRAETDFSSLIASNNGGFSAGGVKASIIRGSSPPGTVETSTSPTDLATTGPGLLPVVPISNVDEDGNQRPLRLMQTGSFRQDGDGLLTTQSGHALLGWVTDAEGDVGAVMREGGTSLQPIRLSSFLTAADPTTKINLGINLPATATQAGSGSPVSEANIVYYNALGASQTLRMEFTPFPPQPIWHLNVYDSATLPAPGLLAEYDLVFETSRADAGLVRNVLISGGNPTDPNGPSTTATVDTALGQATVHTSDGPITLQLSTTEQGQGLTQLAAPFTPNGLSSTGAPAGNLQTLEMNDKGQLLGRYDTGQVRPLYQIPLGVVSNPDALTAEAGQTFSLSSESGDVFMFDSGAGPAGNIISNALNQSNVDIAEELTDMIITQRAFAANATTIRTADDMLAETTNLKL